MLKKPAASTNSARASKPGARPAPEAGTGISPRRRAAQPPGELVVNWQLPILSAREEVGSDGRERAKSEWLPEPQAAFQKGVSQSAGEFAHLYAAIERQTVSAAAAMAATAEQLSTSHSYALGITSAVVGEGKTTVALHLAINAAQNTCSRVCLIDLSLGSDEICRRLGAVSSGTGLVHLLEEPDLTCLPATLLPTLRLKEYANLVIIPAGKAPENAARLARSPYLAGLIAAIRQRFDLIIVDLPAVVTNNALPLAAHLDGVVMVTRAGATPREVTAKALDYLGRTKVIGVVLNRVRSTVPQWLAKKLLKW